MIEAGTNAEENCPDVDEWKIVNAPESDDNIRSTNRNGMPVEGLEFVSEQDGYCYYEDPATKKQYAWDSTGFWYLWDKNQGVFVLLDEIGNDCYGDVNMTISEENAKQKKREIVGIKFDEESGFPIFPQNEKRKYVLPKESSGQPFFPVDENNVTIFPYDFEKKQWTFPVDDTDEPIFPRNALNKPLVPIDDNGHPIFPIDEKGTFIFPLDETNCPIPALTPDGRSVVPTDEFGNWVIPRDREGKPLIHILPDGVTPLSLTEYKQWKQFYKNNKKYYYDVSQQQQQQASALAPVATTSLGMFHPLSLESNPLFKTNDISMLQRTKRVRPEDIDLPSSMDVGMPSDYLYSSRAQHLENWNNSNNATANVNNKSTKEENDVAQKRKKLLSAQLNFSKRVPLKVPQKESIENEGITENNDKSSEGTFDKEQKAGYKGEEIPTKVVEKSLSQQKYDEKTSKGDYNNSKMSYNDKTNDKKHQKDEKRLHRSSGSDSDGSKKYKRKRRNSNENQETDNLEIRQDIKKENGRSVVTEPMKQFDKTQYEDDYERVDMDVTDDENFSLELRSAVPYNSNLQDSAIVTNVQQSYKYYEAEADEEKNFHYKKHKTDQHDSEVKHHKSHKKSLNENIELSNFNINQLNEFSDLQLVKRLIKHTRRKYDDIKKQIVLLEKERNVEKDKLKLLFEVESQVEERLGLEFPQSSSDE